MEPRTYSSCKVQGSLEYTKVVEEKHVSADGSVRIRIENYRNGELIDFSDVRKDARDVEKDAHDVTKLAHAHTHAYEDVLMESDPDISATLQEALEALKPNGNGSSNGRPREGSRDLVWMDGVLDQDGNVIPLRPEESPDFFYQADDEDNEMMTDDNANVTMTHHVKKRKTRKTQPAYTEENNNKTDSDAGDRYQSGPFVYNVPRRNWTPSEEEEEMDFKQYNGFSGHK